jgi:glycogen operon protein
MLLGGDELGRSQGGNNNAFCQDNELSWYDWDAQDDELREFARRLIQLRREHPVFRRVRFLKGVQVMGSGAPDVWWFRADGRKMTRRDWQDGDPLLGMFLNGREIPTPGPHGEEIDDDSFIVLFNATPDERSVMLPRRRFGAQWELELATAEPAAPGGESYGAHTEIQLPGRSVTILKRVR